MGFLQNDTNNIIVDAVLTDLGRQFISRNDGSFSIVKWSPADDEVDYTLIQKFGRTIGQEKIEKNTPIFEALTNQQFSQKYRLISVSNESLVRLPVLSLQGDGVTNNVVSIGNTTVKTRSLTVQQDISTENTIDIELRDHTFIVEMNNLFLYVQGVANPDNIDSQQRATYLLTRDPNSTSKGGSQVKFTLATKSVTTSQFQIYGAKYDKNTIVTYVKVSGVQSGAVVEFEVDISKTA